MTIPGRDTIQLPTDGSGKQVDAWSYTLYDPASGQVTRWSQAATLVDSTGGVLTRPAATGSSLVTVDDDGRRQLERAVLELRQISLQLAAITGVQALGDQGQGL